MRSVGSTFASGPPTATLCANDAGHLETLARARAGRAHHLDEVAQKSLEEIPLAGRALYCSRARIVFGLTAPTGRSPFRGLRP